ncbi:hypothetical protein NQ117_01595 [Paenibacillus sp. SC116]|uniref:hypothetical protein n=1 Tax=Paenibacillus sp. SC116 TaxID=2968986 RepID=UPI00215A11EC|nr:hypothetical protein [Paenibacillus sp. SC116]MCR8842369.1 hypothetical protein [Paenibacillus sp. SC116]
MVLTYMMFGLLFWLGLYICNRDTYNKLFLTIGLCLLLAAVGLGASLVLSVTDLFDHTYLFSALFLHVTFITWMIAALGSTTQMDDETQKRVFLWKKMLVIDRVITTLPFVVYILISLKGRFLSWNLDFEWNWILFGTALLTFSIRILIKELAAQGEAYLPDFLRSLDYSIIFTTIFTGQIALVIQLTSTWNSMTILLLLISICISITFQVFVYPLRALLDSIAFSMFPKLREERAHLRMVEDVQTRLNDQAEPEEMDEDELYRHTRRALSQFGDLQRLAASPLTKLKLIDTRLHDRGAEEDVVERAIELKSILLESIGNIKPRQGEDFGTSDEWRYYNALYFPYIVGIKPYSMRYSADKLDATALEALAWFRTYVPERTYYNWQTAGAKLVALRLKEKSPASIIALDKTHSITSK